MTKTALVKSLCAWAGAALRHGGEHCVEIRPRFRIPGAGTVDLLTLRHTRTASAGRTDHFVVGLWSVDSAAVKDAALDALSRRMHAFEAWYSELLEHAETRGLTAVRDSFGVLGSFGVFYPRAFRLEILKKQEAAVPSGDTPGWHSGLYCPSFSDRDLEVIFIKWLQMQRILSDVAPQRDG
jgi:hypothetical protein